MGVFICFMVCSGGCNEEKLPSGVLTTRVNKISETKSLILKRKFNLRDQKLITGYLKKQGSKERKREYKKRQISLKGLKKR